MAFQQDALEGVRESIEGGHHNAFMYSSFHGNALDHLSTSKLAVGGELREELLVGGLSLYGVCRGKAIVSFVEVG